MTRLISPVGTEQLKRVESLFELALELPVEQREAWLHQACADDAKLRTMLLDMLRFDQDHATDLAGSIGRLAKDATGPRDRSGERIGRYHLIRRIRYGGMAEIYAAVRDDGEFAHDVALKITRSDRRSPDGMAALFQAERGMLARLRHPNICQIFDGGTTEDGEAWFVMERLQGEPLLAACRRHALSWRATLGHFLDLCSAVAHTHRQLIIHRDIKPDNVLLADGAEGPIVKLLDFGIAGRIDQDDGERGHNEHWHSASHAAPEVVAGEMGGIAADVYSLGRLLAELADVFPRRRRAEVEQIAAHASQSEPALRYADVELFAEDLRRMRDRRPISLRARQPLYVARRFAQRRAVPLVGALVLIVAVVLVLVNEQQLRLQAEAATEVAMAQRDRANRIRDFLLEAYESADPAINAGEDLPISKLLQRQVDTLVAEPNPLDTEMRSELLGTLAQTLISLGHFQQADAALVHAVQLAREAGPSAASLWAANLIRVGESATESATEGDRHEAAEAAFREVASQQATWASSDTAKLLESRLYSSWGRLEFRRGRLDDAERMIRQGLRARDEWTASIGGERADTALLVNLGAIQTARRQLPEALQTFKQVYDEHRAGGKTYTVDNLDLLGWIGMTLAQLGRDAEAEPYLREAIEVAEKLYSQPHPRLGGTYGNLGVMYRMSGRLLEAEPWLQQGLDVMRALGDNSSGVYQLRLSSLGQLALEREQLAISRAYLQETLELRQASLGDRHVNVALPHTSLAALDLLEGHHAAALVHAERATELFEINNRQSNPLLIEALHIAAHADAALGRSAQARERLDQAQRLLQQHLHDDRVLAKAGLARAEVLLVLADSEAARNAFEQAIGHFDTAFPDGHPARARAQIGLARIHLQLGDKEAARPQLASAQVLIDPALDPEGPTRKAWQTLSDQAR